MKMILISIVYTYIYTSTSTVHFTSTIILSHGATKTLKLWKIKRALCIIKNAQ